MEQGFTKLCAMSALKEGVGASFEVDLHNIAVFLVEGMVYAVSNVCPHQHIPLISEGNLENHVVTCPMHGWQYDIKTGKGVHGAGSIKSYETCIEDATLYVKIEEAQNQDLW
jgi:nitrite reductase/ring-hydroxylating ferredoxin subunit